MTTPDWVQGDVSGMPVPAHAAALRDGGPAFLTDAFRTAGRIGETVRVGSITRLAECGGGSTGRKFLLSVAYEGPAPNLPTDLFVKFSRDFEDPIRDAGKDQLDLEVRFALLSCEADFPIPVPMCLFADYHRASGTGVLITERIGFGSGGIEPAHEKCLDYELAEPLAHYRALVRANARLAGAHRAGKLAGDVDRRFPFDAAEAAAAIRIRYDADQIARRVRRFADFAARYPALLPANVTSAAFVAQLMEQAPRIIARQKAITDLLHGQPDLIALCHWNANVDNAWFWRDPDGELACGLLDWGMVGRMSVAQALWGGLSAAETGMWDDHLDELLALFVSEYRGAGGPAIDAGELKRHLLLLIAMMGLRWLLDVPALIERRLPDLAATDSRFDARIKANEGVRAPLQMLTNFLNLWQRHDFGAAIDRSIAD